MLPSEFTPPQVVFVFVIVNVPVQLVTVAAPVKKRMPTDPMTAMVKVNPPETRVKLARTKPPKEEEEEQSESAETVPTTEASARHVHWFGEAN